ncbi:helix-turn-helix domain-containing protein [Clostridium sp. CX1]|uniref:helix-turn-helix domain-containing protein n=1 Tax=Clostridium sp. CX1 TaxID=2978346 RepID=UPI0021C1FCDE|nr:helix-turn-helix transcriptional regulator [Clostridium sp. CX1]MCT8978689.1 helix-turn-helix domain-containing protein [Clostridium sp. CX1]
METELIRLLKLAQGDRSLNAFARHADVSPGNLSRIMKGQKPSPEVLKKLASKAHNDISYEQLMIAAEYIDTNLPISEELKKNNDTLNSNESSSIDEKYPIVTDVEKAMEVIMSQQGLMLKGELLTDEDKIILANSIQNGFKLAEELRKKRKEKMEDK